MQREEGSSRPECPSPAGLLGDSRAGEPGFSAISGICVFVGDVGFADLTAKSIASVSDAPFVVSDGEAML